MGSRGGSTETAPITVSACPILTGLAPSERSLLVLYFGVCLVSKGHLNAF